MVKGHRIERTVKIDDFLDMLKNYSEENINCTNHTFFRLSDKQRKIFKCETIKDYLLHKIPHLVGLQINDCYAVFYKYKKTNYIRVILDIDLNKIEVVTFYMIKENQLPRVR